MELSCVFNASQVIQWRFATDDLENLFYLSHLVSGIKKIKNNQNDWMHSSSKIFSLFV